MVGELGDGSHGLHARKSRAALDQARVGEAETGNRRKPCLPGTPAKVPASALIVEPQRRRTKSMSSPTVSTLAITLKLMGIQWPPLSIGP
jgi:hypothetical protein